MFGMAGLIAQPNSDCVSAVFVCQSTYTELNSPLGFGNSQELNWPNNNSCLQSNENYTTWYIFTVAVTGLLEFTIQPLDTTEDYDFILFDFTGFSCSDIPAGNAPEVRCNFASLTPGANSATGIQNGFILNSCGAADPPFCAPFNVSSGETYALVVDHFTGFLGSGGYTITFGGTAVVFDSVPPTIASADSIICSPNDTVLITLSEPVLCSSLASDGSDFDLSGPQALTLVGAIADDCASSSFANSVKLIVTPPVSTNGTYTITAQQGTDGNVLLDNCGNEMGLVSIDFTVADMLVSDFDRPLTRKCYRLSMGFWRPEFLSPTKPRSCLC